MTGSRPALMVRNSYGGSSWARTVERGQRTLTNFQDLKSFGACRELRSSAVAASPVASDLSA